MPSSPARQRATVPPSPLDDVRSPDSTTSTQQGQAAFIYPIKSAVSVKPSGPDTASQTSARPPTHRRGTSSVYGREQDEKQGSSDSTFQLRNPSQGRFHRERTDAVGDQSQQEEIRSQRGNLFADDGDDVATSQQYSRNASFAADESISDGINDAPPDASPGDFPYDEMRRMRLEGTRESHAPRQGGLKQNAAGREVTSVSKAESVAMSESQRLESMMQPRFRHVETEQGHMVVTGRDGEIARCEDEPIHIPGAVQSFGCMVVLRESDDEGSLEVRQCSEVS